MHLLQSSKKKRIAIVGMGYAGLSLCFHLGVLGAGEITLFDRHPHGEGASLVSAGLLHFYPGADARLAQEGREGFHATQELLEVASRAVGRPLFSQKGLIRLAMSPKQRAAFLERAHQHSDIAFLDENAMSKRLPHLPPRAGLSIPHAMVVDAPGYLEGLRQVCFQGGARYVQREVRLGQMWHGFDLPEEFDVVVIAMGAQALFCPKLASLRLRAIKGQVIELNWPDALPDLECPITGDCYLIPYIRENEEKCCLVGATFEKEFTSPLPDLAQAQKLLRPRVEAIVPQFAEARCLGVRAGVRLTTPEHAPIVQQIAPGLWAFIALGSKGLLYHALLGAQLAEAIVNE